MKKWIALALLLTGLVGESVSAQGVAVSVGGRRGGFGVAVNNGWGYNGWNGGFYGGGFHRGGFYVAPQVNYYYAPRPVYRGYYNPGFYGPNYYYGRGFRRW